jgi:hypothetical protein
LLYLLDANVLITANRQYYPLLRVPEFWDWLVYNGAAGQLKIPQEIVEEVTGGSDDLAEWLVDGDVRAALQLDEEVDVDLLQSVIARGYAPDLTDDELEMVGRDPFLVAYALLDCGGRRVVTTEVSKPSRQRANRHIPDVCRSLGVASINSFDLLAELDFSTSWRARQLA